jgi:hypothetical protein
MKVFRAHEKIPAVAITYAGRCDAKQPIILTSQLTSLSNWVITAVSSTIVRDWSISRATIALTAKIGDDKSIPKLPNLSAIRGGTYPYLMEEDEIRIYAGYIDSSDTVIGAHLLDEHPFTVPDLVKNNTLKGTSTISSTGEVKADIDFVKPQIYSDPNKPLAPIFWGFIDQIQIKGDRKAVTCVIQCRDRMRVLHDTKIITLGTLQTSNKVDTITAVGNAGVSPIKVGVMSNLIIEAANTASGQGIGYSYNVLSQAETDTLENLCWKPIVGGDLPIYISDKGLALPPTFFKSEQYATKVTSTTDTQKEDSPANNSLSIYKLNSEGLGAMNVNPWIGKDKNIDYVTDANYPSDPTLWIKHASMKKINPYNIPRFHIWSERAPLQSTGGDNVFTVTNKSPANIIIEMAQIETLPTDVYASHINGDFIYGPRIIDRTGFLDEQRNYRTYFFMKYNPELFTACPLEAQRILKLDVASSSLGVFNTLYVLNGQTGNAYTDFIDRLVLYIKSNSQEFDPVGKDFYGKGRAINPPCKNTVLIDSNLQTFGKDKAVQAAAAIALALNYARIWSRQINTIGIEIPGDPTLFPNEAIRVYNTGLHDDGIYVPQEGTTKIDNLLQAIKAVYNPKEITEATENSNLDEEAKKSVETAISTMIDVLEGRTEKQKSQDLNLLAKPISTLIKEARKGLTPTSSEGNLPVYQIRSIEHTIVTEGERAGFTSKVEAIASL